MGGKTTVSVVDSCTHEQAYEIEAPDGAGGGGVEVVCGRCGIVKTEDMAAGGRPIGRPAQEEEAAETGASADVGAASGSSMIPPVPGRSTGMAGVVPYGGGAGAGSGGAGCRPNLYLELEVGGKPDRTLRGDRYVHRQTDLAAVSNIAQKLGVPNNVGMTVWQWYRRLRKEFDRLLTKAKCLTLAFYGVCRYMGCPITEDRLAECIRMEFGVRHARPYLRVIMEASSYMQNGEMVLRRCGFLNLVGDINGVRSAAAGRKNGGGDVLKFALGTEMQELAERYESGVTNRIMAAAKQMLPAFAKKEDNPRRAARMAVRVAHLQVCGTEVN